MKGAKLLSALRAASASSAGYPLATILRFCSHNLMQAGRPGNRCKPTVQITLVALIGARRGRRQPVR